MAHKSIKTEIVETLEDLSKANVEKFREQLIDRRGEPRVRRCKVEGKTRAGIANVLVSTFTEESALKVTLEVLRKIYCYQEAKDLESRTKSRVNMADPVFRRTSDGRLDLSLSQEALNVVTNYQPLRDLTVARKTQEEMEAEARGRVICEGGDPFDYTQVVSRLLIEFGKYIGRTFKWVLENDVSYVAEVVSRHQTEKEDLLKDQTSLMENKDLLARYAVAYPEVAELVRLYRQRARRDNRLSPTVNHQLHPRYIQHETNENEV